MVTESDGFAASQRYNRVKRMLLPVVHNFVIGHKRVTVYVDGVASAARSLTIKSPSPAAAASRLARRCFSCLLLESYRGKSRHFNFDPV